MKGLAMARLTEKELESFRGYAEANMVEPDGTQSQWADYTVRLIDELREARQTIQDIHMALTILRHDATDGQNWRVLIHNARHELSTLRERIRELEAVVDRLPKTADGVPVVPGVDSVWVWEHAYEFKHGQERLYHLEVGGPCDCQATSHQERVCGNVSEAYSTKEAAEAAKKGGGE